MGIEFEVPIEIAAPPERVWAVTVDLERWPTWDPVVTAVKRLDHGPLGVGSRARIRQPRLLPAVWRVTRFDAPKAFVWESNSTGVHQVAAHLVTPVRDNPRPSVVTLKIKLTGLLVELFRPIVAKLALQYVQKEAQGLKSYCESSAS